ncbi:rCG43477 [Rattus norvegicus]|uniref:RNA polymerase I subunit H, antisense n=2 Tax=Rattus norvegicus TaxID=10116 RepID=D3ZQQ9_RAT|nr:uncharacterized protein LOC685722 [Rattus norvegicus]EDM18725.1 rCG43477 [Rattus norvegicus]|eukprot:NP_001102949.1 uncharacterized protein LOC685722 [Rattus norvegicus]
MEGRRHYYCFIPEKERKETERQVFLPLNTGQARECKNKMCRLFPSEGLPRIVHNVPIAQRRQQVKKREQVQIKDHQERMLRGRELIEQRLKQQLMRKGESQLPSLEKFDRVKREMQDFEKANAHPLLQLRTKSLLKLESLLEMSQAEDEGKTAIKPHQKQGLALPPFLRSHVRKINDQ